MSIIKVDLNVMFLLQDLCGQLPNDPPQFWSLTEQMNLLFVSDDHVTSNTGFKALYHSYKGG